MQYADLVRDLSAAELHKLKPSRLNPLEVRFHQLPALVKPVSPCVFRIQNAFGTLLSGKHHEGFNSFYRISFDPPVGLDKCVDGRNWLDLLQDCSQEPRVRAF
jgi:hypothetical protein